MAATPHTITINLSQIDEDIMTFMRGGQFASNDAYLLSVLQNKVQELREAMAAQVPESVKAEEAALPLAQRTKTLAIAHIIMGQPATYP